MPCFHVVWILRSRCSILDLQLVSMLWITFVYEKLVCQVQQLDITTLILVSMSPLGGPRHKGGILSRVGAQAHTYIPK